MCEKVTITQIQILREITFIRTKYVNMSQGTCFIDIPAMPVLIVPDPIAGAGAEGFEPVRLNLNPALVVVAALVVVPVGP